jgi:hypothetical protein
MTWSRNPYKGTAPQGVSTSKAEISAGMFVTCFFALLDPTNGQAHTP